MFRGAANICLSAVNWAELEAARSKGGSNTRVRFYDAEIDRAIAEILRCIFNIIIYWKRCKRRGTNDNLSTQVVDH